MEGAQYEAYLKSPDPLRFVELAQKPGVVRRQLVREFSDAPIPNGAPFPSGYKTRQLLDKYGQSIRRAIKSGVSTRRIALDLGLEEFEVVWLAVVDSERPLLDSTDLSSVRSNLEHDEATTPVPNEIFRRWDVDFAGISEREAKVLQQFRANNGRWKDIVDPLTPLTQQVRVLMRRLLSVQARDWDDSDLVRVMQQNLGATHERQLRAGFDAGYSVIELAARTGLGELDVAWTVLNFSNPARRFTARSIAKLREVGPA